MNESPSAPERPGTDFSRRAFTSSLVAGLLALGIQQVSSQSSGISNSEKNTSLRELGEELKMNVAQKILDNPAPATLHSLQEYITTELTKKGINPALVLLQIIPLEEKEEDFYEYLRVSITSLDDSLDLTLVTDKIDKAFPALMTMRDNFVEQLSQTVVDTFRQEIQEKGGDFDRESLEGTIDTLLKSKDDACMRHCFKYNCADIYVVRETQAIGIHIQFIDTATQETIDKFVPTGITLNIKRGSSGPTMMA